MTSIKALTLIVLFFLSAASGLGQVGCSGICPIRVGTGSCVPAFTGSYENNDCIGGNNALCKTVTYCFTWPDKPYPSSDSLNVSGSGQWAYYYDSCDPDTCFYYERQQVQCWPQFDNPVQNDGFFSVRTRNQSCSPSSIPWCGFCSNQQPKSVDCQTGLAQTTGRAHTCTC